MYKTFVIVHVPYMSVYMYVYICIYVYMRICAYIYVYMSAFIYMLPPHRSAVL